MVGVELQVLLNMLAVSSNNTEEQSRSSPLMSSLFSPMQRQGCLSSKRDLEGVTQLIELSREFEGA